MPAKADILDQLRRSVAAIERGEADPRGSTAADLSAPSSAEDEQRGAGTSPCCCVAAAGERHGAAGWPTKRAVPAGSSRGPSFRRAADGSCEDESAPPAEGKTADAAFQKILRWAVVRERSTAYVRERLLRDEFAPTAVEEAVERAARVRAIDDRRYADALVRTRLAAGKGLRDARSEIEALGIDPESLDAWQEHATRGREAEVERALALLRRRPPRAKQIREAAFRKLAAQGFDTDVAASAARLWYEETLAAAE